MGCAQSVELCLEMWRLARMRGHDDERSGTVTSCSVMRDGSYRSYVSHEDLVPEVGVTTPEGCYCLLVNKSTTPVVCDVTDMADMTSFEEQEIQGLLEQHPGVLEVSVQDVESGRCMTAFVVLKFAYRSMRSDVLSHYIKWNLPSPSAFKVRVIVVDSIPWSSNKHDIYGYKDEHTSTL